jgi:hypothetical protein
MNKQMVRRWCRQFSVGRQSVHDEKRSGRPSIITDVLVELLRERIMENRFVAVTPTTVSSLTNRLERCATPSG